ncbi:hypothetical protein EC957_005946 [Mortierella hygrophila]|uniref:Uncharacterized protein n=1 Tax=Mortierella hygrophila TaxID=979708 RepID=A0A9P6K626_9FUNG|nr:hypothetical protein EC957_005946 [Mortierella hygrophila]
MVETLTVRKDKNTGELYSLLIDIQETFPDAQRFRVKGAVINFLLDENEQRYDPKRIAYYPDDIIDIVTTNPTQASAILPVSEPRAQLLTDDRMIVTLSSLSIQPALPVRCDAHNDTLTQLAEAKEREEKMLVELAAAKERDEELRRMQQQTIDPLIVARQKIESILVQNYELHEYSIPRLFVILPDSASSDQLTIATAEPPAPIPVKNSIHLAKHEGYELSRPTEFFDQYDPYVLSMLKILRHCLAFAAVIAPAVAMAESGVKDIMDGVKSISESTMGAVDMSIGFLEKTLDDDTDADKILGNLYRITTNQGHVKWVCFDHYKETYRHTALTLFSQSVEAAGGIYDPHFRKISISEWNEGQIS